VDKKIIGLRHTDNFRKDFVAFSKDIFARRSRTLASYLVEAEDCVRNRDSLDECCEVLYNAYVNYVHAALRRTEAIPKDVSFSFRGLIGKARNFTLDSRLPGLLKSKKLIAVGEPVQIHETFLRNRIFPEDAVKDATTVCKVIHYAVFHFLSLHFKPQELRHGFLKAMQRHEACYLAYGSKSRVFDDRAKRGVKLLKVVPVVEEVAEPAEAKTHNLLQPEFQVSHPTELGSPAPTFPEFSSQQRKIIRNLKEITEVRTKHIGQCPLIAIMLLDYDVFHQHLQSNSTKPVPWKPSLYRASGFTKQDDLGNLYLSRKDSGLHTSLNSQKVTMLAPLRENATMRELVHQAKLRAYQMPKGDVLDFYAKFWDEQHLSVDGTVRISGFLWFVSPHRLTLLVLSVPLQRW
jgi:hypothetical protein